MREPTSPDRPLLQAGRPWEPRVSPASPPDVTPRTSPLREGTLCVRTQHRRPPPGQGLAHLRLRSLNCPRPQEHLGVPVTNADTTSRSNGHKRGLGGCT